MMTLTTAFAARSGRAQQVQHATGAFTLTWLLVALPLLSAGHPAGRRAPYRQLGPRARHRGAVGRLRVAAVMFVAMLNKPADGRAVRPAPVQLDPGRRRSRSTPGCGSTRCRWPSCCS